MNLGGKLKKSKKHHNTVSSLDLESFKGKIESAFGGYVVSLDSSKLYEGKVLSTGAFTLDMSLGIGGLPFSKIIEIHGENGSGKTTLCLHCAKNVQKMGGFVVYDDVEHDLSRPYIEDLGIDPARFILVQPECAEEALEGILTAVDEHDKDVPMLIVLDSVAALCPRKELEGEMDDQQIGLQARIIGKFLRKFRPKLGRDPNVIFIATNQIRSKIGVRWGEPTDTPGGKALKFFSSVRIKLVNKGFLKKGKQRYGFRCMMNVIKSKVGIPFKIAEADVIFGKGFDNRRSIFDAGVSCGVIQKSGSNYSYEDITIHGIPSFVRSLDKDSLKSIRNKVKEYYKNE